MEPITDTTNISLSIAVASTLSGALTIAVWRAANFIRDLRDEIKTLSATVRAAWPRQEQERWARELERRNPALDVPPVPEKDHEG